MQTIHDIGRFVLAVVGHWQSYATGGVITGVIAVVERLSGKTLPKKAYGAIFIGVFLLAAFFLAWQDEYHRANDFDAQLRAKPSNPTILLNVPQQAPPQVNVNVPPPVVNIPAQMAYMTSTDVGIVAPNYKIGGNWAITQTIKNISTSSVAENAANIQGIRIADARPNVYKQPIVTETTEEQIYRQFQKDISTETPQRRTYGPGETAFATVFSETIDDLLDKDFREGSKTIIFFSKQTWRDALGWHENDVCEWLQLYPQMFVGTGALASNAQIVWHHCAKHNGLKG